MWKRVCSLLILLVIVATLLSSVMVYADTSAGVTVTAKGRVTGLLGFKAVYINDHQIDLSWGIPIMVLEVMIRAKYGSVPEDPILGTAPTDGYLVYNGMETSVSDTSVDFDENAGPLYYKGFGKDNLGNWYSVSQSVESMAMRLLGIIALWAFAIWLSYRVKDGIDAIFLQLVTVPICVFFGVYWMNLGEDWIYKGCGIIVILFGVYRLLRVGWDLVKR